MCKCTPEIRTPFCGNPGCSWNIPDDVRKETKAERENRQQEKDRRGHREVFLACGEYVDVTV